MDPKATIFVTGATGFIGENLCLHLSHLGYKVNALVRNLEKSKLLPKDPNINLIHGYLNNPEDLIKVSQGCTYGFHVAGLVEPWHRDDSLFYKVNVEGTRNVLEACVQNKVKKVVFTSTAGVYGPSMGSKVREDTIRKIPLTTMYESTKEEAENVVRSYVKKGLDVVIVNPTRVFGRGRISKSNATTMLIDRYRRGVWRILPGDGTKLGNYIHIDDVIEGHILAMEKGRTGENYLLGGESVSYREFFNIIAEETGKKRWLLPLSRRIIIFVSYIMEWQAEISGVAPLITPGFAKKYMYDWDNDSSKAIEELGYSPKPLREGIKRTINWLDQS